MHYQVNNWNIGVGNISILGVSSSSLFIVGDSHEIHLASLFDTPPESYVVGVGDNTNTRNQELITDVSAND
ncbi:spore gernimation protein GerPD [Gracilibacillus caseinilyticus]|uniref:Spore gernimation protein GerPD n=1 Tax=Gracilibacillus caseinilyticus TaxID=2932256 RepID=A0ABY4ES47_9BACI|nr:spore gernimation protein GerPD [Gracilibacillus caseinilyticus]UOQ46891.1 spore gernimation protein GerPD [Gracilibacillus caseinilyticus]